MNGRKKVDKIKRRVPGEEKEQRRKRVRTRKGQNFVYEIIADLKAQTRRQGSDKSRTKHESERKRSGLGGRSLSEREGRRTQGFN